MLGAPADPPKRDRACENDHDTRRCAVELSCLAFGPPLYTVFAFEEKRVSCVGVLSDLRERVAVNRVRSAKWEDST